MGQPSSDAIRKLADWLGAAKHAVAFTGAGISTESGIPDFRSPGGLWQKYRPIDFQDFVASEEMRREAWRRKFHVDETFRAAKPNAGHLALSRLVQRGTVQLVITQNVDGLHQASGIDDDHVVELHGNGTYAKCLECEERHELEPLRDAFVTEGRVPACRRCGGIVKTATISFGQAMPLREMERAADAATSSDLFLVLGSSLVVHPAAGFPIAAKRGGARLVIVNREETVQDEIADLVVHDELGAVLGATVAEVEAARS